MKLFICCLPVALLAVSCCCTKEQSYTETHPIYTTNSPGTIFSLLPSTVQRTITAQAGAAEIKDVNKVAGATREIYEVQFANPGVNPTLYIAENGTLISEGAIRPVTAAHIGTSTALTNGPTAIVSGGAPGTLGGEEIGTGGTGAGVATGGGGIVSLVDSLPLPVRTTLSQNYSNATVIDVQAIPRTLYKFTFKDPGLNPRTFISDDGTIYKELNTP